MWYRKNVGGWERAARLIGGGLMLICGVVALHASPLGLLLSGAGVVTLVTGVFGYCPALARLSGDLLLAAQSGDRHALTQLLVALQPDIRRYARRLCYRTSVIEDVVQEALIVVYRRVGTIRSPAALAGWLLTVIARLCMLPALMLMRGVEELASLEESRELAKVPPDELRIDLVNAIESLSPSHREVLLLRDLEDLTIWEIAGRLGVTREAAKSRLRRARTLVREYLLGTKDSGREST
jgi:RNA polymerase sigma factor (sigma-70 family)